MDKYSLAASLKVAYCVASADEMQDSEMDILVKEMQSYNMDRSTEEEIISLYKKMGLYEAITILRNADDATRNEASALMLISTTADGEFSDREAGALGVILQLCSFKKLSYDEARKILGF